MQISVDWHARSPCVHSASLPCTGKTGARSMASGPIPNGGQLEEMGRRPLHQHVKEGEHGQGDFPGFAFAVGATISSGLPQVGTKAESPAPKYTVETLLPVPSRAPAAMALRCGRVTVARSSPESFRKRPSRFWQTGARSEREPSCRGRLVTPSTTRSRIFTYSSGIRMTAQLRRNFRGIVTLITDNN